MGHRGRWLFAVGVASAAFAPEVFIDSESLQSLVAGRDICGDVQHASSCLRLVRCSDIDEVASCTAEDPMWMPDPQMPDRKHALDRRQALMRGQAMESR